MTGTDTTVLRSTRVVDGTGSAPRPADVIVIGDRVTDVAAHGSTPDAGADLVDLGDLVLSPGFIDVHTHYDAQILWDRDLTPSSWHGVTTVVMGNCGFGIAPTRPEHRGVIARTLENVEGMSLEALEAGIAWDFETFPEYLDVIDAEPTRLNVGAMIGHTPVRLHVLGDEATEREATPDEVARMRTVVAEALDAGAVGFATSKAPTHAGDGGRPVPSRLAETSEIAEIAGALGAAGHGVMQATVGSGLFLREFADIAKATGRPVTWTALLTGFLSPVERILDQAEALGGEVWPQVSCRPLTFQVTLADPFAFATIDAFTEVLAVDRPDRPGVYRDEAWRARARDGLAASWGAKLDRTFVADSEAHPDLVDGPSLADLGAQRGVHAADLMFDLALEEDLRTRFRVVMANDDEDELGLLLDDGRAVLGLSDAGAHASQLCDACFSTWLLGHWVRDRRAITLEKAVWRLTDHAAQVFRIPERGRIEAGYRADLVAFDPDTVGVTATERVHDLPAGADRLLVRSTGIEHVWVNGQKIWADGAEIPASRPGRLIRGGGI